MTGMAEPHIGPYRLLRLLHEGGQGRVFLGQDDRLQRPVAVKIHALPDAPSARRQVLTEARLLARLQHPGVVQIHDVIASEQHLAMVMEYVSGCDLDELLAHTDLCLAESLEVIEGIAAALGAAASRQIVHGDLKTANVLVDREGHIKLADFGIAGLVGEARGGRGSLSCLSPEQARGAPLDTRTDLFALGCLLYRLLDGEYPFYRGGRLDRAALLSADYPPLAPLTPCGEPVPAALQTLVAQLLARDPARRPGSIAALRQRLHQLRRALPRRVNGGLLRVATPVFREETAADRPLPLPADLLRRGASHRDWWRSRLAWWPGPRPAVLSFSLLSVLLLVAAGALYRQQLPPPAVQLQPLQLSLAPGVALPEASGPSWLRGVVREQLQALELCLLVEPRAAADETLQLFLQCEEGLCLLGMTRDRVEGGASRYQQALLPPAAGAAAWESLIGEALARLYREP
ncbi:hypothetical protein GCM10027428_08110 [Haliea atlantica]|nr:hypothetical protein [Haliea sp.]